MKGFIIYKGWFCKECGIPWSSSHNCNKSDNNDNKDLLDAAEGLIQLKESLMNSENSWEIWWRKNERFRILGYVNY
jgi:hypothetical protein